MISNDVPEYPAMYYTRYGFNASRIAASSSAWMLSVIGFDKSRLKIPMIDFASITYLPDTKSKSLEIRSVCAALNSHNVPQII